MASIKIYSPNEHLGGVLSHPVDIGGHTGYSETRGKNIMLLSPGYRSGVVEHEQMSKLSSHYHMRGVQKVSI